MQTNVHIDTKNLRPSPEHRIKGGNGQGRTYEVFWGCRIAYNGHSFGRTSATLLANTGVNVLALKRQVGWKSDTIAESYVAESLPNKNEMANRILYNNSCHTSDIVSRISRNSTDISSINESEFVLCEDPK